MALKSFTTSAGANQPIGAATTTFVSDLGSRVSKAWTGIDETSGEIFDGSLAESGQAGGFIKGLPVSNNFTLSEFFDALDDPFSKDGTNKALAELTGINIWNTVETLDPGKIDEKIAKERVNQYIAGLEVQLVNQLKRCLESYIQELVNKNPDLKMLLDIEKAIINEIGKLRNKVKYKVQREVEKIAYDKIKLQQMALLRQKLTEAIRKICPGHNSPPKVTRLSPSLTRKLHDDRSWQIVDGVQTLNQNIANAEPELAHYAQQPDSTASKVSVLSVEAKENIRALSVEQVIGNTEKTVFSYVNETGELV